MEAYWTSMKCKEVSARPLRRMEPTSTISILAHLVTDWEHPMGSLDSAQILLWISGRSPRKIGSL